MIDVPKGVIENTVYDLSFAPVRFSSKVEILENGCWRWLRNFNNVGYGRYRLNGKSQLAHRVSYEIFKGEIPKGLTIDHICMNRDCVNPAHLEAVSFRVNVLRGNTISAENNLKTHCKRGHLLEGDNVYKVGENGRGCKACRKEKNQTDYRERINRYNRERYARLHNK